MSKTWNKVVLAALLTAGASAGIFYLKHRQDIAAWKNGRDSSPADPEQPDSDSDAAVDRNYINITPTPHEAEEAPEPAVQEAEAEKPEHDAPAGSDSSDVHFASLS